MKKITKSFFKWVLYFGSFIVAIFILVFVFAGIPMMKVTREAKPIVSRTVDELHECLYVNGWGDCLTFTTDEFRHANSIANLDRTGKRIQELLGRRLSAELDDSSLSIVSFAGTNGATRKLNVRFKVIYENDPFAVEAYTFIFDSNTQQYKMSAFNINSALFQL